MTPDQSAALIWILMFCSPFIANCIYEYLTGSPKKWKGK